VRVAPTAPPKAVAAGPTPPFTLLTPFLLGMGMPVAIFYSKEHSMKVNMIRTATALAVVVLTGCASQQAGPLRAPAAVSPTPATAAVAAAPADVATIDGIIRAFYDVVSGPAGEAPDRARDETLHRPGAQIHFSRYGSDGRPILLTVDLAGYYERFGGVREQPFYEWEIHREVQQFGNIAHVWSTYTTADRPGGPSTARGINGISLYNDGERWWITGWSDERERPGQPIPPAYLSASEPGADGSASLQDGSDYRITVRDGYEVHAPGGADLTRTIEEVDYALARFERFFGDAPYIAVTLFEGPSDMMAFDLGPLHARGVPHLPWFLGGREPPSLEGARALSHEACHTMFLHRIRRTTGWTPPAAPPGPEEVRYGASTVPDWMDEAAALLCEFPALQERRRAQLAERTPLPLDSLFAMEHPSLPTLRQMLAQAQSESGAAVGRHTTTPSTDPLLFYAQSHSVATFVVEVADPRVMARLADALAAGGTMEQALAAEPALPSSVTDLEAAWRRWLAQG
jgi:hypothetical protein